MTSREQLGLEIAARCKLEAKGEIWLVPSQSGNSPYEVCPDPIRPHCSCRDHVEAGHKCKHIWAVEIVLQREQHTGSVSLPETSTPRVTTRPRRSYPQKWPEYNAAQRNEKKDFQRLLHALSQELSRTNICLGPVRRRRGRPSLPFPDVVSMLMLKVYENACQRKVTIGEAAKNGYLTRAHSCNAISNYLIKPELTPVLSWLVLETSRPLAQDHATIAIDSTGFGGPSLTRWAETNYRGRREHKWLKAHIACDVATHVVTACVIGDGHSSDASQLPKLLELTARTREIAMVCADKAYNTVENQEAIAEIGAIPRIPFRRNHTGAQGGVWEKEQKFYTFHLDEFNAEYHKRSNVETVFAMIKAKFGERIRSKSETAMINEVYCKVICHNICCLVQSIYERGISPKFMTSLDTDPAEH